MFTERKHFDILNDHHLVVIFIEDSLIDHIWRWAKERKIIDFIMISALELSRGLETGLSV